MGRIPRNENSRVETPEPRGNIEHPTSNTERRSEREFALPFDVRRWMFDVGCSSGFMGRENLQNLDANRSHEPTPNPPQEGSQCRAPLPSSPPGRGQGWVGSSKALPWRSISSRARQPSSSQFAAVCQRQASFGRPVHGAGSLERNGRRGSFGQNLARPGEGGVHVSANVFSAESVQKACAVHREQRLSVRAA